MPSHAACPERRAPTTARPPARALAGAPVRSPACAIGTLWLAAACLPVAAQQGGGLSVQTSLDASLSYADNSRFTGGGDFITQISPGLQLSSRSGRVRGSLSYSLNAIQHSLRSEGSGLQNYLNAAFTAEAVENRVYVDASAVVSQSALSAFGRQQVTESVVDNDNRTEIGTVSVSPYVRGALGGWVTYDARLNASATNGRRSIVADSDTSAASLNVNSANSLALLGWGLLVTSQRSDFRAGRETETSRASASLLARPNAELSMSLRGGQERTDVLSAERQTTGTWGAGATWTPSERTQASIDTEHRYFGQSHRVVLEHRLARTAFRFSSTRDASTNSNPGGVGQPVTLYQLYNALALSRYPDPIERDQAVRSQLRIEGLDPDTVVAGGFVSAAVTLQQRNDLGFTYAGKRLSLSLQAFSSRTSGLDRVSPQATTDTVRQRGVLSTVSWRLTPTATAALSGSLLKTLASGAQPGTDLKSLSLNFSDQIGRRISAALTARHSVFDSPADGYHESALTASMNVRF